MKTSMLCILCMHSFPNVCDKASNCKSRFLIICIMSFIALWLCTPQIKRLRGRVRRSLNVTPAAGEEREGGGKILITYSCPFYDTKCTCDLVHELTRPAEQGQDQGQRRQGQVFDSPGQGQKILVLRPRPRTNITG
jgi:hypothetical protein